MNLVCKHSGRSKVLYAFSQIIEKGALRVKQSEAQTLVLADQRAVWRVKRGSCADVNSLQLDEDSTREFAVSSPRYLGGEKCESRGGRATFIEEGEPRAQQGQTDFSS